MMKQSVRISESLITDNHRPESKWRFDRTIKANGQSNCRLRRTWDRCDAEGPLLGSDDGGLHPETAGGRAPGAPQGRPAQRYARSPSYVDRRDVRYCLTKQYVDTIRITAMHPWCDSAWSEPVGVSMISNWYDAVTCRLCSWSVLHFVGNRLV